MPERLPIQDAKEIAHKRGLRQVILLAWDGERSHVVTYGKSIEDCDQAAQGGEKMKKLMGWPNWEAQPSRVKKLSATLEQCREHLERSCMPDTQPLLDAVNAALRRSG